MIFIPDFGLKFLLAPHKLSFLKQNIITLISLLVPALRLFRLARVFRAARAVRGLRLVKVCWPSTALRCLATLRLRSLPPFMGRDAENPQAEVAGAAVAALHEEVRQLRAELRQIPLPANPAAPPKRD